MPGHLESLTMPGFTLAPRDPFADAKETLSSWDNCMAKDYCKWPVIVAIIIGSLIAFSVVFCIARCICCGAECAMCCCSCCCGSSSGHRRMKSENQYPPQPYPYPQQHQQQPYANSYAEARSFAPPPPQINTQYQSHPPPSLARQPSNPNFNPQVNPNFAPAQPQPQAQYATFDARPTNEDALPAMPSWSDARSRHVEVEDPPPQQRGDVEMDRLDAYALNTREVSPGRSPVSPVQGDGYAYAAGGAYAAEAAGGAGGAAGAGYPRGPSPAQSYTQYSQTSDAYQNAYAPAERYTSPPPPSYHTTAQNPYTTSYTPSPPVQPQGSYYDYDQHSASPVYAGSGTGIGSGTAYDPVPRSANATPSYPGQATYQAFQPGQSAGVVRKPVQGSLRDV